MKKHLKVAKEKETVYRAGTVRRSVALPVWLVKEASGAAPYELKDNLNGLVTAALKEFVERRKEQELDRQMAEMANDLQLRKVSQELEQAFRVAENDGLEGL